jgi:hypothetical protein
VVQGFPEDHRIHQGLAGHIVPVKLVDVFTADHKAGYLPIIKTDAG